MAYYERTDSRLTGSDMCWIALSRISLARSSEIAPGWLVSRLYPMHCTLSLKLFGTAASAPWVIKECFEFWILKTWKPSSFLSLNPFLARMITFSQMDLSLSSFSNILMNPACSETRVSSCENHVSKQNLSGYFEYESIEIFGLKERFKINTFGSGMMHHIMAWIHFLLESFSFVRYLRSWNIQCI